MLYKPLTQLICCCGTSTHMPRLCPIIILYKAHITVWRVAQVISHSFITNILQEVFFIILLTMLMNSGCDKF